MKAPANGFLPEVHRLFSRIRRAPDPSYPVWTKRLVTLLVFCIAATLLASRLDSALLGWVRTNPGGIVAAMDSITAIGLARWYLIPAGVTLLFVSLSNGRSHRLRTRSKLRAVASQASFVIAAIAASSLLVNIAKVVVGRSRPVQFDSFGAYSIDMWSFGYVNASFPSGHATILGVVATVGCLWFRRHILFFVLLGGFMAATRVAADVHYLSDIVAGYSLGAFLVVVFSRWLAGRRALFRPVAGRILPDVEISLGRNMPFGYRTKSRRGS